MKLALLLLSLSTVLACSKPEEKPRRTEPWLATPSASASASALSGPVAFELLPESQVRFTLTGRRAKPSGAIPLANGRLELVPRELARSRATLVFDLLRLELGADGLPGDIELGGASPSEVALRWLELGQDVPEERRAQHRHAVFELSAIEDAADLDLGQFKQGTRATVVGSLRLHGFRTPVRTRVELRPRSTEDGSLRLSIRSLEPVVLSLVAHDIGARGANGVSEPTVTDRWLDVVGKTARVDFDLVAQASKRPAN